MKREFFEFCDQRKQNGTMRYQRNEYFAICDREIMNLSVPLKLELFLSDVKISDESSLLSNKVKAFINQVAGNNKSIT